MRSAGLGSMPGTDYVESVRTVLGVQEHLAFVPELPARGVESGMIGRSLTMLEGLSADLQPAGWRLLDAPGADLRRAASLLAHDLDVVEEHAQERSGVMKQQVAGPWTLAATVELQRGEKVLSDHGARRDLAESLAVGVAAHVEGLRRRVPGCDVVLQLDEPMLPAVLAARVPTASGYGRYRTVDAPEADALLRIVVDAVHAAGATVLVHCCAPDVPVALLRGTGVDAISFDLSLARTAGAAADVWAETFESGTALWPGIVGVPADGSRLDVTAARDHLARWFDRLGFAEETWNDGVVVTPTCGLAGAGPAEARQVLVELAALAD